MSDVRVVRYLLAHNTALLAVVPAAKIMAGVIPENTVLPAIGIMHVSTLRRHTVAATATEFCTSRVSVTVMAMTYPLLKSTLALVRAALPRTRGTVDGVNVDSLLSDIEGPDFYDDEITAHMGSLDFIVTFSE